VSNFVNQGGHYESFYDVPTL